MNSPFPFEQTYLWRIHLAPRHRDPHAAERERLRSRFLTLRENIAPIASSITLELSALTDHSVLHLDALWKTASLITGEEYIRRNLNAHEVFILGVAFLLHDIGMSLVSFPGGIDGLKQTTIWKDTEARLKSKMTFDGGDNQDLLENVLFAVLREIHPERAEKLAVEPVSLNGESIYLLEERALREHIGVDIGRLAASHGKSLDYIKHHLDRTVDLGGPEEWKVDFLKLSAILRIADYVHFDFTRIPQWRHFPKGNSKLHWLAQNKLHSPTKEGEELIFRSRQPFSSSAEDISAWWLVYDMIGAIQKEILDVDGLLRQHRHQELRLPIHGILGAGDPLRLSSPNLVEVSGWHPVDTRLTVSNVADLVRTLGGEQLYGHKYQVPMRELIQNACDAICARRTLKRLTPNAGRITIGVEQVPERDEVWIEIHDDGIGMTSKVITEHLLQFGTSYWQSEAITHDLPGLLSSGFAPIGRYGIGFFSVFMWGDEVKIITRRDEEGSRTLVLEWQSGLNTRPTLRNAHMDENMSNPGTQVRVRSRDKLDWWRHKMVNMPTELPMNQALGNLLTWMCPTIEVDVWVKGESDPVIIGGDWRVISEEDLMNRLYAGRNDNRSQLRQILSKFVTPIYKDSGEMIGRSTLLRVDDLYKPYADQATFPGILTVGGFRTGNIVGFPGVFVSESLSVARDKARPVSQRKDLARWAENQKHLIKKIRLTSTKIWSIESIHFLGAPLGMLKFARVKEGWLNYDPLVRWLSQRSEIIFVECGPHSPSQIEFDVFLDKNLQINENVLFIPTSSKLSGLLVDDAIYEDSAYDEFVDPITWQYQGITMGLIGAVFKATIEAWSVSMDDIFELWDASARYIQYSKDYSDKSTLPVGTLNSEELATGYSVLRRPNNTGAPRNVSE